MAESKGKFSVWFGCISESVFASSNSFSWSHHNFQICIVPFQRPFDWFDSYHLIVGTHHMVIYMYMCLLLGTFSRILLCLWVGFHHRQKKPSIGCIFEEMCWKVPNFDKIGCFLGENWYRNNCVSVSSLHIHIQKVSKMCVTTEKGREGCFLFCFVLFFFLMEAKRD